MVFAELGETMSGGNFHGECLLQRLINWGGAILREDPFIDWYKYLI